MKKSRHFSELSDKGCDEVVRIHKGRPVRCGKKLKLRVVENKEPQNITKCFRHYTVRKRQNAPRVT